MRKYLKKQCIEIITSIEEAHRQIVKDITNKNIKEAVVLLEDCQQGAIQVGTSIDEIEGEGTEAVHILEDYCEFVYGIHEDLLAGHSINARQIEKKLKKIVGRAKSEIRDGLPTQYEVVFLPYKASMWDSLESVWKAACEDDDTEAYVIPIPYYDKNPDGSYSKLHYEGTELPEYVPITHYAEYDFKNRHPDTIYIHNPYDGWNIVTTILPDFYSDKLKEYTDDLVYIPYFVLEEPDATRADYDEVLDSIKHFVTTPGVLNADKVIVQSEAMKKAYVRILCDYAGKETKSRWEKKIYGTGSPKFDRVLSLKKEDFEIPDEWQRFIKKPDGSDKKIIFYNTSVGALLQYGSKMLVKMRDVFEIFRENADEIALLWRPHPLIEATISSMRPQLWDDYRTLVAEYRRTDCGIYDDSEDVDRAIVISDAYYGDWSSVVWLCQKVGMPIMIQNPIESFIAAEMENEDSSTG